MTTYNTQNPLGSADPRDLYDNAENADRLINGTENSYPDRLGNARLSWAGIESRFADFLANSGYQFVGDYAAGITITEYNQVVRDASGEFWRLSGSTGLPYTTTGAGLPEGGAFLAVGDAALRQELADGTAAVSSSTGSQTIAEALDRRGIRFTALRAPTIGTFDPEDYLETSTKIQLGAFCYTLGYYAPGDGGGNDYEIVATGTGANDGGSFIDLPGSRLQAKGLFKSGRNLLQFGARADGDYQGGGTDNTLIVQAVYDYLESDGPLKSVTVLNKGTGCYRVDGPIFGRKNTLFLFQEGATFDFQSSAMPSNSSEVDGLWEFKGAWSGSEIPISANLTTGDTTVTTTTAHGLSVGDKFLIKGQRNSLYSDAGDWRLGRATGSVDAHALYFGEPCIVDQVVSTTQVVIRNPLTFPDYRTDDTLETSPAATRPTTTIQKMDLLPGAKVIGGEFLVGANGMFYTELCDEPFIHKAKVKHAGEPGVCFLSRYNYRGVFTELHAEHPEANYLVEETSQYNSFKSRSDWHTEWSATDVNGMQGIDLTYVINGVPTLFPSITKLVSVNSFEQGFTTHAGVYGWKASNIHITGCKGAGIFLRSRNGILSDFFIETKAVEDGIRFSEWAVDISVSDGRIKCGNDGFFIGTHVLLPGAESEQVEPRRNISMSNITLDVGRRVGTIHNQPIETLVSSGITLTDFTILDFAEPLRIESFVHGLVIDNWSARSRSPNNTNPAINLLNDSTLNTVTNVRRLATVPAPAVSNMGVTFSTLFDTSVFGLRGTGNIVKDCIGSNVSAGVVNRDFIKAYSAGDFTLSNPVAREGVFAFDASATAPRSLTLPAADAGLSVTSINVGSRVTLVNNNTTHALNIVAGAGATVDSSRFGSLAVPPLGSATVELVRPDMWVLY